MRSRIASLALLAEVHADAIGVRRRARVAVVARELLEHRAGSTVTLIITTTDVPEPSILVLLASGLAALGAIRQR